ncbi:MAG: S41 family peptidase [Lachnospiraceae bacterium]|nr:S41 family peptidase [Lachnospiraceae bacterium]
MNNFEELNNELLEEDDSPKKSKKGFGSAFNGFLVGMIVMSIVCIILLLVQKKTMSDAFNEVLSEYEVSDTAQDSIAAIQKKIKLIETVIDNTYLYDIDYDTMAEDVYKAMVDSLGDKYSAYYTVEEYKALMSSTNGTYAGLGALVSKDEETGYIRIVSLFEGSGAAEAGIQVDDLVTAVEGASTADMELSYATSLLKGEEGTTVNITVNRPSTGETWDVVVTRNKIEVTSVAGRMLDNGVGIIAISEFDAVTVNQFSKVLKELTDEGMTKLIIDLRSNPGGLVSSVVSIVDELLPEGLIVYTEDKDGNKNEYSSDASYNDIPLAILIDGNSASASEIMAGAIQDYGRGVLIGTQSFGKGIVQTIRPLADGSAVKLTISTYYTPNGRCIHGTGITPDIVLEYDSEAAAAAEDGDWESDNQVKAAYDYLMEH